MLNKYLWDEQVGEGMIESGLPHAIWCSVTTHGPQMGTMFSLWGALNSAL